MVTVVSAARSRHGGLGGRRPRNRGRPLAATARSEGRKRGCEGGRRPSPYTALRSDGGESSLAGRRGGAAHRGLLHARRRIPRHNGRGGGPGASEGGWGGHGRRNRPAAPPCAPPGGVGDMCAGPTAGGVGASTHRAGPEASVGGARGRWRRRGARPGACSSVAAAAPATPGAGERRDEAKAAKFLPGISGPGIPWLPGARIRTCLTSWFRKIRHARHGV